MSEKAFWGVSVWTKGGHSKLRGQPLQRHASSWRRCVQMAHGEDLDRLNGGSESSVHFVWGRAELNKIGWSKAQQTTPYQCSHPIFYSLPSKEPVQNAAHIGRDVVIFRYATNKTGCRAQNAIQAA